MEWHSGYVAGCVVHTLEADFRVDALKDEPGQGQREIFNTVQRSLHQRGVHSSTQVLKEHSVKISING